MASETEVRDTGGQEDFDGSVDRGTGSSRPESGADPIGTAAVCPPGAGGALASALALHEQMPKATATKYGDSEGLDWWERNAGLFEDARKEYGMLRPDVYTLSPGVLGNKSGIVSQSIFQSLSQTVYQPEQAVWLAGAKWLQPELRQALTDGSTAALRSVLREVCRDSTGYAVYAFDLFTDEFCDTLLQELDHLEASGIPLRRPNGMNRYGCILSQLGFQEGLLDPLARQVMLPLARELWPEWCDPGDCDEVYGFVVRYRQGEDLELAEHADTSNVTLNACLGRQFEGSGLYFKGLRFSDSENDEKMNEVSHKKGVCLIHLGGQFHGARPLTSGDRSNIVLWGMGKYGVVRIRPNTPQQKGWCGKRRN